jgi:hypothetical protein
MCIERPDCFKLSSVVQETQITTSPDTNCSTLTIRPYLKHSKSNTKLYTVWQDMKARCCRKSHKAYGGYGGRGIQIHECWNEFPAFYIWAMNSDYQEGLTLDRVNNDGHYSPQNCRWATRREQNRNRRNNVWVEFEGQRKLMADWMRELGIGSGSVQYWKKKGWSRTEILQRFSSQAGGKPIAA